MINVYFDEYSWNLFDYFIRIYLFFMNFYIYFYDDKFYIVISNDK